MLSKRTKKVNVPNMDNLKICLGPKYWRIIIQSIFQECYKYLEFIEKSMSKE